MHIAHVGPEHANTLADLLGNEHGCYCRYWFFGGDKNAWFAQCATSGEDNAAAVREECTGPSPGLIALQGDVAIGWMRLAPLGAMSKLTTHGTYKRLALTGDNTLAVACVYVREEARNAGVHRALVDSIPGFARAAGALAVLAFPAASLASGGVRAHDAALMMGVQSTYIAAGFQRNSGDDAYPVLRLEVPA